MPVAVLLIGIDYLHELPYLILQATFTFPDFILLAEQCVDRNCVNPFVRIVCTMRTDIKSCICEQRTYYKRCTYGCRNRFT